MVWRYTLRYPAHLAAAAVSLAVAALATLFIPRTFQKVIDHGFGNVTDTGNIAPYFQGLLAVVVVLAIATAFRFYFVSWLGERTVADIRIAVQANLLRLAPRYFEENRPSEIASRLTADTTIIEQVVGSTVSIALRNVVIGIGGTIYLFALSPKLTLSLLVCIPLIVLPIVVLGRRVRSYSRDSQDKLAEIGATAVETLGAMKVVQAFGQERREAERFELAVSNGFATSRKRFLLRAIMTAMVIGLFFGGLTLLLWEAVADVASGRLSGGSLTAFVVTGMLVAGSFQALTEVWGTSCAHWARRSDWPNCWPRPEIAPPLPRPFCRSYRWARCGSTMSCSIIRPGRRSRRSTTSRSTSAPARRSRWSGLRARASRLCSSWPSVSMTRKAATSRSTACRCAMPIRRRSARASRWCRRRR